jgi:molybdopterin-guanine dinucleotide biosynthesis protein MobB
LKRIHIIGGKNHGKTTLIEELVRELTEQGMRIGTIKHTHHQHELDTPGKDSHRHREAGSAVVGICTRAMNAVFWPPESEDDAIGEADCDVRKYAMFAPVFEACDLVLVEGDSRTSATKF